MGADDTLRCRWSKREKDLVFYYPSKPDGRLLNNVLCEKRPTQDLSEGATFPIKYRDSFIEELEARGYDITTLKFSVKRKAAPSEGSSG